MIKIINIILYFLIMIMIIRIITFYEYNNNINDYEKLLKLAQHTNKLIKYHMTQDNTPLLFVSIIRLGDCLDRSKYVQYILNTKNIKNEIQYCYYNNNYHARNMVYLNDNCYILDSSVSKGIIQSCNIINDYCEVV